MCIFARCLSEVLEAKGRKIGSLHTVVVDSRRNPPLHIPPLQVMRLQRAATGDCTISVTLNPAQLEAVRNKFSLTVENMRRLRAALLAESALRLLMDRIPLDQALEVADGIFQTLQDADVNTLVKNGLDFDSQRTVVDKAPDELSSPLAALEQRFHNELEPVAQAYDEAVAWLSRTYAVKDTNRQHRYAELASSRLTDARKLLDSLTLPEDASPLLDAWNGYIEETLLSVTSETPSTAVISAAPAITDENNRFQVTAFYAREAAVETWDNTLLAYAHIVSALKEVRRDARNFSRELGTRPKENKSSSAGPIPRNTEIILVPTMEGVRFDPEAVIFRWVENWHRTIFRFKPDKLLAGDVGRGEIAVYATINNHRLHISTVRLAMMFEEAPDDPSAPLARDATTAKKPRKAESEGYLFRNIFASYAHEDATIVQECSRAYQALGIVMHIDYLSLLSGQEFASAIMELIDSSDVFQLYWSDHAAASEWVSREWEYALRQHPVEGFIRPLYWQEPMPPVPEPLGHIHFARLDRDSKSLDLAGE